MTIAGMILACISFIEPFLIFALIASVIFGPYVARDKDISN
jgi:hypothetical protein